MAYDERLATRVRAALPPDPAISERKMFGGICFLVDGKMFAGLATADLMVRVGPAAYDAALARKHARPMDFTGRPLTGYVYVAPAGIKTAAALATWILPALDHARALPAKKKKPKAKPRARPRAAKRKPRR